MVKPDCITGYDGEYQRDRRHCKGKYTYETGEVEIGCYEAGADVG